VAREQQPFHCTRALSAAAQGSALVLWRMHTCALDSFLPPCLCSLSNTQAPQSPSTHSACALCRIHRRPKLLPPAVPVLFVEYTGAPNSFHLQCPCSLLHVHRRPNILAAAAPGLQPEAAPAGTRGRRGGRGRAGQSVARGLQVCLCVCVCSSTCEGEYIPYRLGLIAHPNTNELFMP